MATGIVNSIQTLGTVDGPGIRFVVFTQGCNLRCGCCHNPDTWAFEGGKKYSPVELAKTAQKYSEYFGKTGGVTLSGGEPLLQAEFAKEFFIECKKGGINTCLDTSGCILNDGVKDLLFYTDRVLLDIKYSTDKDYLSYVGQEISKPLEFLEYLNEKNIKTTLRRVIIPTLNDKREDVEFINELVKKHKCIDSVELLPFKKICKVKYDNLGIDFAFDRYQTPTQELMQKLNGWLKYE